MEVTLTCNHTAPGVFPAVYSKKVLFPVLRNLKEEILLPVEKYDVAGSLEFEGKYFMFSVTFTNKYNTHIYIHI